LGAIAASLIAFVLIVAGTVIGILLRRALPEHHLSEETRDVVRLATGLVGTVAALVLGLMVASAKNSYDTQASQITNLAANLILLDQVLERYGAESRESRELLRKAIDPMIQRIWREDRVGAAKDVPFAAGFAAAMKIMELEPQSEAQRQLKAMAIQVSSESIRIRLLLFVEAGTHVPIVFLTVLVLWLALIFASFSLFTDLNHTMIAALCVCALSAACAIYLILDLGQPFWGLMQISSDRLRNALPPLEP
jgi:hypothetical protein